MIPYDEFWKEPGVAREHQADLLNYIKSTDPARKAAIERAVAARIVEQEISFNILGDPDGTTRPWRLDPWPLLMSEQEFNIIAGGMEQRAHLLNDLLDDIYGPQRFLAEGLIPSELVFGNPRYFRSITGVRPLGGQRVTLYAADLARTSTGVFQVYSDRTAAPTGSGYALENRLVLGQVHSELFRSYRVQKINSFFALVRETLRALRSNRQTAPRIVLLTPGLHDESSFEHAYLARYLGLDLVEGRDLTVRGDEVFLKTLEGLKKVDVILRRIADDWCDPLELREDSILGVSGLVAAARAGTVGIVNPLGSGVVEAPVFKAYLEDLHKALHGNQPMILPSIPCRWLGDPKHKEEVFDTLDAWIYKPAFNERSEEVIVGSALNAQEKAELRRKLMDLPQNFVAEKWSDRSLSPLSDQTSQMAPMTIRLFACRNGNDYQVMPGGMVRLNDDPDGLFLSTAKDSISKDLWIPSKNTVEPPQLPSMPVERLQLRRGGIDLPSRLFDDIFWLGRYIERCDNAARLVRTGLEPIIVEGSAPPKDLVNALSKTIRSLEIVGPAPGAKPSLEVLLRTAIYDRNKPNSVRSCLDRIRTLTKAVRSRLSRDAWDALRRLGQILDQNGLGPATVDDALSEVQELIIVLAAVHGIIGSNMVRGHAWMFVEMGRRLEHGVFLLTLIQDMFPEDASHLRMATLLNICDSTLTYRSRYLSTFQPAPVADLILTDASNPASVLFQVKRLLYCVRRLPGEPRNPLSRAEQRLILLETQLVTADLERACSDKAEALRSLAEDCINLFWQVSDDLARTYFSHAGLAHAVKPSVWVDENLEAR